MTATAVRELVEMTPEGKLKLNFHAGQWRAWESERRFILVLAGSQSGKTVFGPHWLYREMQRQGPGDYMVVAPSLTILTLKAYPAFLELFAQRLDLGTVKVVNGRNIFTFSEAGSIKTFGSYDANKKTRVLFGYAAKPETLESATLLAVWADEAGMDDFKAGAWGALRRRLSISRGRVLITTTPYNLGWLKEEIYEPGKAGDPDIEVIQFDSTENPSFPMEEYRERERTMPRWLFNMMYRGQFERPAGLIYDCFSRPLHVVSAAHADIDPTWPRYVGMDYGLLNFAALIFARDPTTKRFYCTDEYSGSGFQMRDHVQAILAKVPTRSDGTRPRIRAIGGAFSEDRWRREVTTAGLPVERPDQPNVEIGIQRVYSAFMRNEVMVLSNCTALLEQLATYARKLDENNEPTEEIKDKAQYHYCFVAGTMIDTSQGLMPIEKVGRGTLVLTRDGYRQVRTPLSRDDQPLRRVEFSDGKVLIGTPDHPIWVSGSGFKAIDSLRYGDRIETILDHHPGRYPWADEKPSSTMASRIIATLTQRRRVIDATSSDGASTYTAPSGKKRTVQSLTATTSITRTATTTITPSIISQPFLLGSTNITITVGQPLPQSDLILTGYAHSPLSGMAPKPEKSGIVSTLKRFMPTERPSSVSVSSVGSRTSLDTEDQTASAPTTVKPRRGGKVASMMRSAPACIAALCSRSTSTPESGTAPVHVRTVQDWGSGTVYNLTVADIHEYFANGVLVSNCDCMRYAIGTEMRHAESARTLSRNRFNRRVRIN